MKKNLARQMKNKVSKHLKGDIKMFHHEAAEDKELMKALKELILHHDKHRGRKEDERHERSESKEEERKEHRHKKKDPKPKPRTKKAKQARVKRVMDEWKMGELHSGSKKGPMVKNRKQAIAIALSEAGVKRKKKRK